MSSVRAGQNGSMAMFLFFLCLFEGGGEGRVLKRCRFADSNELCVAHIFPVSVAWKNTLHFAFIITMFKLAGRMNLGLTESENPTQQNIRPKLIYFLIILTVFNQFSHNGESCFCCRYRCHGCNTRAALAHRRTRSTKWIAQQK